ncbi:hypothetical protein H4R34_000485 [Dimargaris verticillata]|uniref:tripeptidyl-peptidase II n=1 Tax=Dimargaris verticillata TaxID=2761393 RepID=A0A9W8B727_9FUNG|nr:hypothetical protein H4R34_000485 [Dimargaris verticillata]
MTASWLAKGSPPSAGPISEYPVRGLLPKEPAKEGRATGAEEMVPSGCASTVLGPGTFWFLLQCEAVNAVSSLHSPELETEAAAFLKKFPEYDGRGTVIAVLDTGVDPAAYGLQTTTDGKPKIIDIIDCTGSGDVAMNVVEKPTKQTIDNQQVSTLPGISGRTLLIPDTWTNPSGEYHLGLKAAFDLFPDDLAARVAKSRRAKNLKEPNRLLCEAESALAKWKAANPSLDKLSEDEAKVGTDLERRASLLQKELDAHRDRGVIMDCVVFHDGTEWRAVLDTKESGDLRDAPVLRDYKNEPKYYTLGTDDQLSYSVKFYDDGKTLSIVTVAGYHGTHVAGIIAAHHPEEPELNGIISLKIGDHRLGSMETGTAVTRAAIALVENQCDLANMSYGEPTSVANVGYFIDLVKQDVIKRYGCIFVASAGNEGPALSTLGAPGGASSHLIGVGAHVNHSQMQAEYGLLEYAPEVPYTWSSRGPSYDGDIGVDIFAPGSAVTSYPAYTENRAKLLNGTSMSSPNCCGCIALLLSGLKAKGKVYTPFRIKSAIKNSALSINDSMNVGYIQVDKAWQYIHKFYDQEDQDIFYHVLHTNHGPRRGVYLRDHDETSAVQFFQFNVTPLFMNAKYDDPDDDDTRTKAKFAFEKRVTLVTTTSYVQVPDFVYLNSAGNNFKISVDPTQLDAGRFYFTEVKGFDAKSVDRGPLFSIPVTICKPQLPDSSAVVTFPDIRFSSAQIERRFVHVPLGASHATVRLLPKNSAPTQPALFLLQIVQLRPHRRFTYLGTKRSMTLFSGSLGQGSGDTERKVFGLNLGGHGTVELCLGQFWSAFGDHSVTMEIEFHGFQLIGASSNSDGALSVDARDVYTRLDLMTPLRREQWVSPTVKLDSLFKYLQPTDAVIQPLGKDRDQLPDGTLIKELVLTYKLSRTKNSGETYFLSLPALNRGIYEMWFDNVYLMVYDVRKQLIHSQSAYVKPIKLSRVGDYTVLVQLRYHLSQVLEQYHRMPLKVETKLSSTVKIATVKDIARLHQNGALSSSFSVPSCEKGQVLPFYILSLPMDKPPVGISPGDVLGGRLTLGSIEGMAVTYPVAVNAYSYTEKKPAKEDEAVSDSASSSASSEATESDTKPFKSETQLLTESLWRAKMQTLKKTKDDNLKAKLIAELDQECATFIPYLVQRLDTEIDGVTWDTASDEKLNTVMNLADRIIGTIDKDALTIALHSPKPLAPTQAYKDQQQDYKQQKNALKRAYTANSLALGTMANRSAAASDASTVAPTGGERSAHVGVDYNALLDQSLANFLHLAKADNTDYDYLLIYVAKERKAGRYGLAWSAANEFLANTALTAENVKKLEKVEQLRIDVVQEAGYTFWVDTYNKERIWTRFTEYAKF